MATTLRTSGITMGSSTLDVSGGAPSFTTRAWINLNGTGTIAARSSGNLSFLTDLGTGLYRFNFTTAMADANYAVNATPSGDGIAACFAYESNTGNNRASANTSKIDIQVTDNNGIPADRATVNIVVFR